MPAGLQSEIAFPTIAGIPTSNLLALFNHCNEHYFNNELEPSPGFKLTFSRSVRLSGCFTYCLKTHTDWGIAISRRLQEHPRALLSTLVHEMIHMLAHQRSRKTGDAGLLDESPIPGEPFVNPGHGAFFIGQLERLNQKFPGLGLTVKSTFGDHLYEQSRILPVRLLLVFIDRSQLKGMVYRLHPQAPADWPSLRATAMGVHGTNDIKVVEVPGQLAEGFPSLRRDNAPRKNMRRVSLRNFDSTVTRLINTAGSRESVEASASLKHSHEGCRTPSSENTRGYPLRNHPVGHAPGSCVRRT